MRDYYEFIFTVAENTDKMAQIVYDYVEDLEKAMKELDKELDKMGEKNSSINASMARPPKGKESSDSWVGGK